MTISEKELEDFIFKSEREFIHERGLYMPFYRKRQLRLGNYGIADIVGMDKGYFQNNIRYEMPCFYVYELKKDAIGMQAFIQAIRYAKGIKHYLSLFHKKLPDFSIKIILIGSEIDRNNDFIYLPDFCNTEEFEVQIYTYSFDAKGIHFENHYGYLLANHGLSKRNNNSSIDFDDF